MITWHSEFPKLPQKQHATKKEPSWDRNTSSPFDMWRQPKQKSLWYRAIWMPVAPNYGAERCPLKPKLHFTCFEIFCSGSWSTEFPYMATLTLPRGCPQVSPWFQKGFAVFLFFSKMPDSAVLIGRCHIDCAKSCSDVYTRKLKHIPLTDPALIPNGSHIDPG